MLKAATRSGHGTGPARAVRREGKLPGVIYGETDAPTSISVDAAELTKAMAKGRFFATLLDVELDGKKIQVLPRDVQLDPVRDHPIHVDFQRIGVGSRLRVKVPTRFINDLASPGLKRGGVLNVVRHEVEVICPATAIPVEFVFDLTGLEIGRSLHISATTMPEGVRPTILGRDFTVATIAGAVKEEEAATATTPGADAAAPAAGAAAPAAKGGAAAPAAKGGAAPAKGGAAPAKGGAAPAKGGAAPAKAPAKK